MDELVVIKRDGRKEKVMFDKITSRIEKLCYNLDQKYVCATEITLKVINGVYPGVTTIELDNLAAEIAASMTTRHPDYATLAARIVVSNLHKETRTHKSFSDTIDLLYNYICPKTNKHSPLISDHVYRIVMTNKEKLNSVIVYNRDFDYSYFGFKTLERSYLMKVDGKVVERPQHMLMRVSVGIHLEDIDAVIETYNHMSERWFTHATPTLFNAGTPRPQMSSCFLLAMKDDSIEGIFDTLKNCALISKFAGGIGLHVHNIRATGTFIAGTNGISNGIVPLLRVYNNCSRYVDQGGNKRPGSFAIYLEPWHADIEEFLDLRKNTGSEEIRARDLFYALWIPDLFMKRVEENGMWSLMCPHECPGLADVYGDEFEELYIKYENEKRYKKQIEAQKLWFYILEAQIETGQPYMLYKDACNKKSNQKNLGVIKSSNLCTEIIEYSASDETAVCNLASISLSKFVVSKSDHDSTLVFNFQKLHDVTKIIVRNLNKVIDLNFYPIQEAYNSNMRHRPIGIGVQGLADVFIILRMAFESQEAKNLNILIFETIYHAALEASCELAKVEGIYSTYDGSPISQGILQYDMWNVTPSDLWDWNLLKSKIKEFGVRNSLLLAPMPTASTSQILGNNEAIEPFTSNIYSRRVLSGEFQVVNQYLLKDLVNLNIWNDDIKNQMIADNGSIQNIDKIPQNLKDIYKTAWEMSMKTLIDMAADRGAFIDQSQSFNVFMAEPNFGRLTSMHFYSWKKGLKTGMYYLRTKPGSQAIKFTVDASKLKKAEENKAAIVCSLTNPENCMSCGS